MPWPVSHRFEYVTNNISYQGSTCSGSPMAGTSLDKGARNLMSVALTSLFATSLNSTTSAGLYNGGEDQGHQCIMILRRRIMSKKKNIHHRSCAPTTWHFTALCCYCPNDWWKTAHGQAQICPHTHIHNVRWRQNSFKVAHVRKMFA